MDYLGDLKSFQEWVSLDLLYPDEPELLEEMEQSSKATVDFLARVRERFSNELHRAYVVREFAWEYAPGVMPNKSGYGAIGETIPSFRDCSQTHKHLMFLRGYILAEVGLDPDFPDHFDLDINRTMLDIFLLLVEDRKDRWIPAYFLEEEGLTKMISIAQDLKVSLPAALAPRLLRIADAVRACDSQGEIAEKIQEIAKGQYQLD